MLIVFFEILGFLLESEIKIVSVYFSSSSENVELGGPNYFNIIIY